LFAPLDRRLQRRRVRIAGVEIVRFLNELFGDRLKRHDVELVATDAFKEMVIVGYPSTFYPTFVNLIDNAIFWVGHKPVGERRIILDGQGRAFTVSDSGPGIPLRDAEAVFEMGFTRRPTGRGMGLYISRQVLAQVGYSLALDPPLNGQGATFRVAPLNDEEGVVESEGGGETEDQRT